eukprot:COSAG01_NODE_68376_length_264_cov_0.630303_1_plen_41_part_10
MRPECRGAEGVQLHAFACRGCYSNGNVNTPCVAGRIITRRY